ncbi:MAG: hypothetical protein SGPRY_009777, partial [Prymnesium sp.]
MRRRALLPPSHPSRPSRLLHIVFIHPDLGIGGAERLIVDAALTMQRRGHRVSVLTSHHDPSRCFTETRDGTLQVRLAGAGIPPHLFGRFHIVCATLRGCAAAIQLILTEPTCDVVAVDQVAAPIPLLRLAGLPVLFYCHFPDKLLASPLSPDNFPASSDVPLHSPPSSDKRLPIPPSPDKPIPSSAAPLRPRVRQALRVRVLSWLKAVYRAPFDLLEELCTGMASDVLVNSAFTASVFASSFRLLHYTRGTILRWPVPHVLHPSIDLSSNPLLPYKPSESRITLVSINRFEVKKDLGLAIGALHALRQSVSNADCVRLVMAGGWDARLTDQVEYYEELQRLVGALGLSDVVELRRNVSDDERLALFEECAAVVYTPSFEHFGIVPLEAMAAGRPVIAVRCGGPCETVVHGETGWLCEPTEHSFAAAFAQVVHLAKAGELPAFGSAARSHVENNFAMQSFADKLERSFHRCSSQST